MQKLTYDLLTFVLKKNNKAWARFGVGACEVSWIDDVNLKMYSVVFRDNGEVLIPCEGILIDDFNSVEDIYKEVIRHGL